MPITQKYYGWRPSRPDFRDLKYSARMPMRTMAVLPPVMDLESQCPVVYDQGDLGSCTANAGGALAQFLMMKLKKAVYRPSRLAIYYWERVLENTVLEDSGASIKDAIKVMYGMGVPPEWMMPYEPKKFREKPSKKIVEEAAKHKIGEYLKLRQDLKEMKNCLAEGYPFMFGFSVYGSFETDSVASSGILPLPGQKEAVLGGHAVMAVGYNDKTKFFKIRNSWGADWGQKGYYFMPYDYLLDPDLAADFWTFKLID